MPITGEYAPSPEKWVRDQVEAYESSGGIRGNTLPDTEMSVVIVTSLGARTGKVRKTPLMRIEHGGRYALVASQGGAPKHPHWYFNLINHPHIELQDGPILRDMMVRLVEGDEKATWWQRAVETFPPYEAFQARTERVIPVFVAEPA